MRFNTLNIQEDELPKVTQLFLYWHSLKEVPDLIFQMPNLEHLNLEGNRISSLPGKLKNCQNLKKLELGTNAIHSWEPLRNLPPNLTKLDLTNNEIQKITEDITGLKHLEELHLNACSLTRIPAGIKKLQKLRVLNVYNNRIKTIPLAVGKLESLRELIIGQNRLKEIPDVIGQCSRLSKLSANENNVSKITTAIGYCTELNLLELSNNKLKTLPDSLQNCLTLQNINLSWNKLEKLPEVVLKLKWLSKLFLKKNALIAIDFKGRADRISFLDLSDNKIDAISNLPSGLEVLHLINNKLTQFPEALLGCANLRHLYLDQNKIVNLPKDYGTLSSTLEMFGMLRNPAKTTPEHLLAFTNLKGFSGLVEQKKRFVVLAILHAVRQKLIREQEKFVLLRLLLNKAEAGDQLPLPRLISFLNVDFPTVTQKIRKYIYTRVGIPLSRKRLKTGHRLAIIGNTSYDHHAIRDRLHRHGITLAITPDAEVTHLLLGWGKMEWSGDAGKRYVLLSEKQLGQELWRLEAAHLLKQPDEEVFRSVEDLMLSQDNVNVRLGLELLKTGGINNYFMNYLIINWIRPLKDPTLSEEFLKQIRLNSEDEWKFVLDKYSSIRFLHNIRNVGEPSAEAVKSRQLPIDQDLVQFFKKNKLDTDLIKKALSKE